MGQNGKKTDIWMPLYIGDYLAATTHLSALESGAYLHLLMHQWKNGKLPSSSESLRRIARVEPDAWSNAWAVLGSFFDDATGSPSQIRLEQIREEWNEKQVKSAGKAKAAAESRWSKAKTDAPSNAQALPQPCPSPSPSSVKTTTKTTAVAVLIPEWITPVVWAAYLEMRKKKRAVLTDRALNGVLSQLGVFRNKGHDPNAILDTSIRSSWTDVYEPKGAGNGNRNHGKTAGNLDAAQQAIALLKARDREAADEVCGAATGSSQSFDPANVRGRLIELPVERH